MAAVRVSSAILCISIVMNASANASLTSAIFEQYDDPPTDISPLVRLQTAFAMKFEVAGEDSSFSGRVLATEEVRKMDNVSWL